MFKIGQKVVAIRDHSKGAFKKGQVFTILDIKPPICSCNRYGDILDIGIRKENHIAYCHVCNHQIFTGDKYLVGSISFVPIQEDFQAITLTKVLEIETPLIGVN